MHHPNFNIFRESEPERFFKVKDLICVDPECIFMTPDDVMEAFKISPSNPPGTFRVNARYYVLNFPNFSVFWYTPTMSYKYLFYFVGFWIHNGLTTMQIPLM